MTLINIPESPDVITEEEITEALTTLNLIDNVVGIDDISEIHFRPGEVEVVYVKDPGKGAFPLLVHRTIRITPKKPVQDS